MISVNLVAGHLYQFGLLSDPLTDPFLAQFFPGATIRARAASDLDYSDIDPATGKGAAWVTLVTYPVTADQIMTLSNVGFVRDTGTGNVWTPLFPYGHDATDAMAKLDRLETAARLLVIAVVATGVYFWVRSS